MSDLPQSASPRSFCGNSNYLRSSSSRKRRTKLCASDCFSRERTELAENWFIFREKRRTFLTQHAAKHKLNEKIQIKFKHNNLINKITIFSLHLVSLFHCQPVPLQCNLMCGFFILFFWADLTDYRPYYYQCSYIFLRMYIYFLLCVLNKDIKISQSRK